jgi:hypothetical protein
MREPRSCGAFFGKGAVREALHKSAAAVAPGSGIHRRGRGERRELLIHHRAQRAQRDGSFHIRSSVSVFSVCSVVKPSAVSAVKKPIRDAETEDNKPPFQQERPSRRTGSARQRPEGPVARLMQSFLSGPAAPRSDRQPPTAHITTTAWSSSRARSNTRSARSRRLRTSGTSARENLALGATPPVNRRTMTSACVTSQRSGSEEV